MHPEDVQGQQKTEFPIGKMSELMFTPESADSIRKGIKLGTTKIPESVPPLLPGMSSAAVCGEDRIPIVILGNTQLPLGDLSTPRLALGGFFSIQEAVQKLTTFFKVKISVETPVNHIVFLSHRRYENLSAEAQALAITLPIEEGLRHPLLRPLFFPSLCQWLTWKKSATPADWLQFLIIHGLVSNQEALKTINGQPEYFIPSNRPKTLQEVLNEPSAESYRSLILVS